MSSAEPLGEPLPNRAARSIRKAKAQPTTANIVDAMIDMHEELSGDIAVLKADVAVLKDDVAVLKAEMTAVRTDVGKLLHHFGLISGGSP